MRPGRRRRAPPFRLRADTILGEESESPDGEIGRRSGLKIRRPQGRGGSSPPPGTNVAGVKHGEHVGSRGNASTLYRYKTRNVLRGAKCGGSDCSDRFFGFLSEKIIQFVVVEAVEM